jgi:SAM-dependent methyltransferase
MISTSKALEAMAERGRIVESLIASERPELIDLFVTYQNEAIAARKLLARSLIELDLGADVLEIGGGILALAIQLASEGFKVTTVEPVGKGFSGISYILSIYSEIARNEKLSFTLIETPIEVIQFNHKFDFIFSINVMEHLKNPYSVLKQMTENLNDGGRYRFFCPNYGFPYEPHFGKLLILRRNGAFYLERSRANSAHIRKEDLDGLYESINYITLDKVLSVDLNEGYLIHANKNALFDLISRAIHDSTLQNRHEPFKILIKVLSKLKYEKLCKAVPTRWQPMMDVEVSKVH